MAAIVRASSDAIISKTLDSTITSWNAAAERIFGYSEEDMILAKIAAGEQIEHCETVRLRKDEQLIDVSGTVSPLYDTAGKLIGASKIARDVTERNFTERRLAEIRDALSVERQESEPNELAETETLVPSGQSQADREAAIGAVVLLPSAADRAFEPMARPASGVIQSPTAPVTLVSGHRHVFLGAYGVPPSMQDAEAISAELDYAPSGVRWKLTAPARNVMDTAKIGAPPVTT